MEAVSITVVQSGGLKRELLTLGSAVVVRAHPHQLGIGFGIPSGAGKRMIERLTLAADGLQLRYELTLEDPEYLAAPVSYIAAWDHRPDLAHSNLPCDPEIAERFRAE